MLYYWRHGRRHSADILRVVFVNRDDKHGIEASVKLQDDMWHWRMRHPGGDVSNGTEQTQEEAQSKVKQFIDNEFRPEYIPYFG